MTIETDDCISTARTVAQLLLGQCVLKLQGFEWLVKVILTQHRVSSGSGVSLEYAIKARADEFDRFTLGTLVAKMMAAFIVADGSQQPGSLPDDAPQIEMLMCIRLHTEDYQKAAADLRDLITLRNRLIHHFVEDHDLHSLDGCEKARSALVDASDQITKACDALRIWADDLVSMQSRMADLLNTPEIRDTIIGGRILWPITGVVRALQKAEVNLANDGWTSVVQAEAWILQHYPHEHPVGYGCGSWRQVIHESRLFDLSYRTLGGRREAWFRSKSRHRSVQ